FGNDPQLAQLVERFKRIRAPQFGMTIAMQNLQVLRYVLDVNNSAGAVFDIDPARLDQFAGLTAAQMQRILPIPGSATVSEAVATRLHTPAQSLISGHPSQFDERLAFERRGFSMPAVVILQLLEGSGQSASFAMGPESEVNVKDAFLAGFDELDHLLRQMLEEETVVYRPGAARPPLPVVNEQHFQIGGVTHLAPAEFAQAADRERRRRSVRLRRLAVLLNQTVITNPCGLIERDLGEVGQRLGEINQRDLRVEQMLDVNQKDLAVLEPVESPLFLFKGSGL